MFVQYQKLIKTWWTGAENIYNWTSDQDVLRRIETRRKFGGNTMRKEGLENAMLTGNTEEESSR